MKFARICLLFTAILAASTAPAAGQGLDVGDPAPPLSIVEWVQGRPIDLKKDAKKRFHVVEFWATWCPPCKASIPLLTGLQKKYGKDVVIIGVTEPDTRGNSPSAIRKFVKDQGANMSYTIAIDSGKTIQSYLAAAGVVGIPHAFVVDKKGIVVWQGSPLEPALGAVLGSLVEGTFDFEAAKRDTEVMRRMEELNYLAQVGQWRKVWDGVLEILKLDPANELGMNILISMSVQELGNRDELRKWIQSHLDKHRGDALVMRQLSKSLCNIPVLKSRFPDLALQAAKSAHKAAAKPDIETLGVYALAMYQIGKLDRAIALQQDAVAMALDDVKKELLGTLDYYRACKELQGKVE